MLKRLAINFYLPCVYVVLPCLVYVYVYVYVHVYFILFLCLFGLISFISSWRIVLFFSLSFSFSFFIFPPFFHPLLVTR